MALDANANEMAMVVASLHWLGSSTLISSVCTRPAYAPQRRPSMCGWRTKRSASGRPSLPSPTSVPRRSLLPSPLQMQKRSTQVNNPLEPACISGGARPCILQHSTAPKLYSNLIVDICSMTMSFKPFL